MPLLLKTEDASAQPVVAAWEVDEALRAMHPDGPRFVVLTSEDDLHYLQVYQTGVSSYDVELHRGSNREHYALASAPTWEEVRRLFHRYLQTGDVWDAAVWTPMDPFA